jgi:hypothetical protein
MNCQDIVLNRRLEDDEIRIGLSSIFNVASSEVLTVEEIPSDPISQSIRVLCQVQDLEGEFKQLVSIYVRDQTISISSLEESLGQFCSIYKCSCLIADDSKNPYSMTLITAQGNYQTVYLQPELLDEGQYVLS